MKKLDSKIVLLAIRCEFIGGPTLTKKGKGLFPAWVWRKYANVHRFLNTDTHKRLIKFLRLVQGDNIVESALQD